MLSAPNISGYGSLDPIGLFYIASRLVRKYCIKMEMSTVHVYEGQNVDLCRALTVFEHGGIFIVPHLV